MTMNLKLIILASFLFSSAVLAAARTSYEGYKLVNVFPKTQEQFQLINQLEENTDFDLWGLKPNGGKVSLSPKAFPKYAALFRLFGIKYEIVHNNLEERMQEELVQLSKRPKDGKIVGKFARHNEIESWLAEKVASAPAGLLVSTYVAGLSYEGRRMTVIKIGTANTQRKIWIDCGIHAREWISPASCIYMIDALLKDFVTDATVKSLLEHFEFHILPVVNPDGYEYSYSTTRLWRKNRAPNGGCTGVDLNRNYGYQWLTGGSSTNPCSDTYAGPNADSEPETQAVQNAIKAHLGEWEAFITIHTYGKWIFTVWGYTRTLPNDFAEQNDKARITRDAIHAVSAEKDWTHGSSAVILYVASGGSEDWAKGTAEIPYAYCWELRPGSDGIDSEYGFQLPEDRIPAAGAEAYAGLKAFASSIKK